MSMTEIELAREVWDRLAGRDFTPARLNTVDVDGYPFQRLYLPRREEFAPRMYLRTDGTMCIRPRFAAYRYRCILAPPDFFAGTPRWQLAVDDLSAWMDWAVQANHVVTMSTLKSGASTPLLIHAQSFPLNPDPADHGPGVQLTALANPRLETSVPYDTMPGFPDLRISRLVGYPAFAWQVAPRQTAPTALRQAADKVFEFALNYDHLKSFNLVIVPAGGLPLVYFFPRRRQGRATWGDRRWQIAALEHNGLMQVKDESLLDRLDANLIREIFAAIAPTAGDLDCVHELLETF